jgi:hypothetical protein
MDKFTEWVEELRQRFLKDWDENGKPPLVGRSEEEIVQSFSKLRQFNTSKIFHSPEKGNDADIIGVIANFSKNGSAANQFFPTMLKTKIASGTSEDTSRSIYDFFTDEIKNPYFREGETLRDFFLAFKNGDGRFDAQGLRISKISCTLETYNKKYTKYLTIKADEIREFVKDGILDESMTFYLGDIDELTDTFMIKKDGEEPRMNVFLVRVFDKNVKLFPQAFQIFRISFSQIFI